VTTQVYSAVLYQSVCIATSEKASIVARFFEITGHKTRAMFDRYNIGREEDAARAREVMEAVPPA